MKRKWKSGAKGCWWIIVRRDSPYPWSIGLTREIAWQKWRDRFTSYVVADTVRHRYIAKRVFIVEAE